MRWNVCKWLQGAEYSSMFFKVETIALECLSLTYDDTIGFRPPTAKPRLSPGPAILSHLA